MLRACALYAASCSGISLRGLKWFPCVQACKGRKVAWAFWWIQDYKPKTFTFSQSCSAKGLLCTETNLNLLLLSSLVSSLRHSVCSKTLRLAWLRVLTLMLLVANLANTESCKGTWKMTETLAHGYSSEDFLACPRLAGYLCCAALIPRYCITGISFNFCAPNAHIWSSTNTVQQGCRAIFFLALQIKAVYSRWILPYLSSTCCGSSSTPGFSRSSSLASGFSCK